MTTHCFALIRASRRWLAAGAVLVAMTGCATQQSLYQWGGYDAALYGAYKNPETVVELQTKLETHIAAMQTAKQKVAPGLYAELGSLYLQQGKSDAAITQYRMERELWPESRTLMDAMIQTLENRAKSKDATPPDAGDAKTGKEAA
ncbi:hypothetical protein SDC9_128439 [bioreactor metagenome]|uniref:DUF4810 domain-containing protein n=1 Tax=bioreactor metagenome TaxID=1076179 RepID=A0A645CW76_9ZZZZ